MQDDTFENLEVWKDGIELAAISDADAAGLITDAKLLSKRLARFIGVRREKFN